MLERSWKKRGSSTKVALQDLLDLSVLAINGLSPITERDFRPSSVCVIFCYMCHYNRKQKSCKEKS